MKELEKKTETVHTFLGTRMLWTNYTADVAARLPAKAVLSRFDGRSSLNSGKGGAGKSAFNIGVTIPLAADGSTPREIDAFLNSLRSDPVLQRDFASAELTGISQGAGAAKNTRVATFGIVCLPKGAAPAAAASPSPKKKGAK